VIESQQRGLSIGEIWAILRRRIAWIAVCFFVVTLVAYASTAREAKKYTATAAITFGSNQLAEQIAGLSTSTSTGPLAQQASDVEQVSQGKAAAKTAQELGRSIEEVTASVAVGARGESDSVEVAATTASPELSAKIANTYANEFVKEQQAANRDFFRSALALVNRQLAAIPASQQFGAAALDLHERAHTLSLLAGLGYSNAQVAVEAAVPSVPSSPHVKRNTILGALLGLLLGIALAFALERFDPRVRGPQDLADLYGVALLGTIPRSTAFSDGRDHGHGVGVGVSQALPPEESEAFDTLQAHLRYFKLDHDVRTLLIVSPERGDGKTTLARYLAEAAARLRSRVLLVEADMREPSLMRQYGVGTRPGLSDVLLGSASDADAATAVRLPPVAGGEVAPKALDVLFAGSVLPPNPGELMQRDAVGAWLARAKARYELVVIDTPSLSQFSDAFPLLAKVDGVIAVGRVGVSRRDAAEGLRQVLTSGGAPLLGIVANCSAASGSSVKFVGYASRTLPV
jgi:capsular exopolysaccharide synthesis family protein